MADVFDIFLWTLEALAELCRVRSQPGPAPLERFAPAPRDDDPQAAAERRRRAELGRSFASLLMAVARADGRVADEERAAIAKALQQRLGLTSGERTAVANALGELGEGGVSLSLAAARCREQLDEPDRAVLLDALYAVADADLEFTREEQSSIRQVATLLELDAAAQKSALARNRGLAAVCYDVLGIHPGATDEEVRSAYLRLTADPSPAARREEIETAYQQIRDLRGA